MRVKIGDLVPNPYRDIKNYPINREKVETLKVSINDTGFWDNILARKHPKKESKYQIAYGHHRLIALQELYKDDLDHYVNIPVKDLSDALMIKIMANENMEDWRANPAVIDETVKVAKKFLEEHLEEAEKLVKKHGLIDPRSVSYTIIARFLSWKDGIVKESLIRLELAKNNIIDLQATNLAPSNNAATTFAKQFDDIKLPVEKQKSAVEKVNESKDYSEKNIRNTVLAEKYGNRALPKKHLETDFKRYIDDAYGNAAKLLVALKDLIRLKNDLHESLAPTNELAALTLILNEVAKEISNLKNTSSNGNTNTKPNIKLIAGI